MSKAMIKYVICHTSSARTSNTFSLSYPTRHLLVGMFAIQFDRITFDLYRERSELRSDSPLLNFSSSAAKGN